MNIQHTHKHIVGLRACMLGIGLSLIAGPAAWAADLTVSAAASLSNAFKDLAPAFEARHPGTKLHFNFAASDALLAQISKGAPVDVFAAADQDSMDRAESQKLLAPGSRRNFVSNQLVLITPADSKLKPNTLADLNAGSYARIALGQPASVPAGRYAKSALEGAKLWLQIEPRAIYAQNVRQSLDYVARGEVDAGFVYATDALVQKGKVKVAFTVPGTGPILYPVAAIQGSSQASSAQAFVEFLTQPEAQAVLARHGFGKP